MNTNITIRLVKISDAEDLQKNIYSRNSLNQTREIIYKSLEQVESKTSFHLVAEIDGAIVGNIKTEFKQHVLEKHRGVIFDFVVNPRYRKKGIAKLLFNKCKEICLKNNILILETSVRKRTSAEIVYRKLGFIQYGELPKGLKESWDDEETFDQIFFYMNLNR